MINGKNLFNYIADEEIPNLNYISDNPDRERISTQRTPNSQKQKDKAISQTIFSSAKKEESINLLNSEENKPLVFPKSVGIIKGFGASCFKNKQISEDDKICVVLNFRLFSDFANNLDFAPPKISYFGLFDANQGNATSEFLRENLHKYIVNDEDFLLKTDDSIINALKKIDGELKDKFYKRNNRICDNSGSSVLLALIINEVCYIANLGNSRALMSTSTGEKMYLLTNDQDYKNTRAIGHIKERLNNFGTKFLSTPDILIFKITPDIDFIILGSDSLFEKLSNHFLINLIYEMLIDIIENNSSLDYLYSACIQKIYTSAVEHGAEGALSCIIIFFENFINLFIEKNSEEVKKKMKKNNKNILELYNVKPNIIKNRLSEEGGGDQYNNGFRNSRNLVINNINNNINITQETKIYWCCFKRKSKKKRAMSNSANNLFI